MIFAVMVALALIFGDKRLFFNQIILCLVLSLQVAELLRFINHTNRELAKFLLAIKHKDFSINFNKSNIGESFTELNESFTEIINTYKKVTIENEAHFHYLKMVVSNINIGIISIENDEDITLINEPAIQILHAEGVKTWKIMKDKQPGFVQEVDAIGSSGRKLIHTVVHGVPRTLSVDVNSMITLNKTHKLITFQDIKGEIEQTEIEAWHKLIRILTHEIMNSATPISSLTETMQTMLEKDGRQRPLEELTHETIEDLRFSLKTIQKRSDGMVSFIDDYRKLAKVAKPKLATVDTGELFGNIQLLMSPALQQAGVVLTIDNRLERILIDSHLIEQVLINLITNSIHALENIPGPEIQLSSYEEFGKLIIEIRDNGCGIPQKELSQIFVPFFSTKKQGSGIGLSLSKQIMHLHGGYIKVESWENKGTTIRLIFRSQG